mgnify:CR=1 FL=1
MNTIKNLVRLTSYTATVLITALWLPTTTFALDLPVRNGSAEGVMSQVENCHYDSSHHSRDWLQVEEIGFGETDPANQQSRHSPTSTPTFENRVSQTVVGFAETDPVSDSYVFGDESDNKSVVICHGESSKHVVVRAASFLM